MLHTPGYTHTPTCTGGLLHTAPLPILLPYCYTGHLLLLSRTFWIRLVTTLRSLLRAVLRCCVIDLPYHAPTSRIYAHLPTLHVHIPRYTPHAVTTSPLPSFRLCHTLPHTSPAHTPTHWCPYIAYVLTAFTFALPRFAVTVTYYQLYCTSCLTPAFHTPNFTFILLILRYTRSVPLVGFTVTVTSGRSHSWILRWSLLSWCSIQFG